MNFSRDARLSRRSCTRSAAMFRQDTSTVSLSKSSTRHVLKQHYIFISSDSVDTHESEMARTTSPSEQGLLNRSPIDPSYCDKQSRQSVVSSVRLASSSRLRFVFPAPFDRVPSTCFADRWVLCLPIVLVSGNAAFARITYRVTNGARTGRP